MPAPAPSTAGTNATAAHTFAAALARHGVDLMFGQSIPSQLHLAAPGFGMGIDCDVLVPAALGGAIDGDNASAVRARVVLEVANGPLTADADAVMAERNVTVVPDILANAGGVTVSHLEWTQNRSGDYWSLKDVRDRLERRMTATAGDVLEEATERDITLRQASYLQALRRLCQTLDAKGTERFYREDD